MAESEDPRVTLAVRRTSLAKARTLLASERTLMAWVRTAVSLVSFGYTVAKIFQLLGTYNTAQARLLGVGLILLGTLGLASGIGEYVATHRRLYPNRPIQAILKTYAVIVAMVMVLVGLTALMALLPSSTAP